MSCEEKIKENESDLPSQIYYFENGNKNIEVWIQNGLIHRYNESKDLPGCIKYYKDGSKKDEKWYKNGELHRNNDLPSHVSYYENGSKKEEKWFNKERKFHRESNPAWIRYYENGNGNKMFEGWFQNGKHHCKNLNDFFSWIEYYENGNKKEEKWFKSDTDALHCIKYYNKDGKILGERWVRD